LNGRRIRSIAKAGSGDIIRAFGKNGYIWQTTQGDAAQVKTILSILKARDAKKIALLAENSTYGKTFYDWTGFFATEYGIEVPPPSPSSVRDPPQSAGRSPMP